MDRKLHAEPRLLKPHMKRVSIENINFNIHLRQKYSSARISHTFRQGHRLKIVSVLVLNYVNLLGSLNW